LLFLLMNMVQRGRCDAKQLESRSEHVYFNQNYPYTTQNDYLQLNKLTTTVYLYLSEQPSVTNIRDRAVCESAQCAKALTNQNRNKRKASNKAALLGACQKTWYFS
jgi:hypothetical protein